MRVTLYPNGKNAMGYYRMIWAGEVLRDQGYDVVITDPDTPRIWYRANSFGDVIDVKVPETDVAVVQRVTQKSLVQVIDHWQKAGIRVVVDIDDNLSRVSQVGNPAAYNLLYNPDRADELHWRWTDVACKMADAVVVSTVALEKRYGYGHSYMVENRVPAAFLSIPHTSPLVDTRLIGWSGAVKLRAQDPEVVGGALAKLTREGFRFRAITEASPDVAAAFRIDYGRDIEVTGFVPFDKYPHAIAQLGVGIVPLAHTQFNIAKSWLTPMVMAACGVPCVMSDVPEYARIFNYGIGYLAHNQRRWYSITRSLATNEDMYWRASQAGRDAVRKYLTIEGNADRWWEAWTGKVSH